MRFRSEGDLIYTVNASRNLVNLICAYLEFWRKHANGLLDIYIPDKPYTVVIQPPTEGKIKFVICYTKTSHYQVPQYYDIDDDMFQEGFGVSNISGYSISSSTDHYENYLSIPMGLLLQSESAMEESIIKFVKQDTAKREETKRLKRIEELKQELTALEK